MSIENSGSPSGADHDKARRDLLLKVYDAAINEYRFNVQLGWDRTKFFLGLAVTGIAAGAGLIRLAEGSKVVPLFLCFFFALLVGITWSGWLAAEKSKKYTRRAVLTKTLVERELGLLRNVEDLHDPALHLAVAVTPSHRDFRDILFNHE